MGGRRGNSFRRVTDDPVEGKPTCSFCVGQRISCEDESLFGVMCAELAAVNFAALSFLLFLEEHCVRGCSPGKGELVFVFLAFLHLNGVSNSYFLLMRPFGLQVTLVGSGNWGTAVGRLVAANAKDSYIFQTDVRTRTTAQRNALMPALEENVNSSVCVLGTDHTLATFKVLRCCVPFAGGAGSDVGI